MVERAVSGSAPHVGHGRASAHYRAMDIASRVESADPHMLVAILYDELLTCIDIMAASARLDQPLRTNPHVHRARAIIVALRSGLDFTRGGDTAMMLASVYAAVADELEACVSSGNIDRIGELHSAVESVSMAWRDIAAG